MLLVFTCSSLLRLFEYQKNDKKNCRTTYPARVADFFESLANFVSG